MSDDAPKKRRHGPKPKPPQEQRRHAVSCRLTDAELARLDELRGEVSRGEWLRLAAMAKPPRIVPTVNKVAWADLARAAGNLNQITRAINEGKLPVKNVPGVGKAVMEVRAQLDAVRRLLIGQEAPDESEG
ncbi:plasmid mobilization relaxosome protein MobC [Paracoccus sp. J55]|uniref:plasmid mobilization relaxosome protein MobC n=1 Tax=Paracoccus sp. J55 TaxID=935849 RepID=UPI000684CA29|nr:plasmid mobilization relaxosome protein MobC [Paracoccus sp. J55]